MFKLIKKIKKKLYNIVKKNRISAIDEYNNIEENHFVKRNKHTVIYPCSINNDFDKMDLICPICLDNKNLNVVIDKCEHWFHYECLVNWLKKSNSCPLCRQQIFDNDNLII